MIWNFYKALLIGFYLNLNLLSRSGKHGLIVSVRVLFAAIGADGNVVHESMTVGWVIRVLRPLRVVKAVVGPRFLDKVTEVDCSRSSGIGHLVAVLLATFSSNSIQKSFFTAGNVSLQLLTCLNNKISKVSLVYTCSAVDICEVSNLNHRAILILNDRLQRHDDRY